MKEIDKIYTENKKNPGLGAFVYNQVPKTDDYLTNYDKIEPNAEVEKNIEVMSKRDNKTTYRYKG